MLGSLRCDCRDQLTAALESIGQLDAGVVLYLRQEGRGIGLTNKIRAYALQDHGHDTVDANHLLGFGDDERDYSVAADMLAALGVRSVVLMTNNPAKVEGLREHGVKVTGRLPLIAPANRHNQSYLPPSRSARGTGSGSASRSRCRRAARRHPRWPHRAPARGRRSRRARPRPRGEMTAGRRRGGTSSSRCSASRPPRCPLLRYLLSPLTRLCEIVVGAWSVRRRSRTRSSRAGLTVSTV